jgi:hypothetical protein
MPANSIVSLDGINLATKYEKGLVQAYTRASLLTGKTNSEYNWDGVKSIHVYTAITQALNDYNRSGIDSYGGHRYGAWNELQDREQEMIVTLDKSFAITIDKGNNDEQQNVKRLGEVIKAQIGEQVTPFFDSYALKYWTENAGSTNTDYATLTSSTVLNVFSIAHTHFFNNNMPINGQIYAYVPTTVYALLLHNPEFISVDKLGEKILSNGVVGKCMGFPIVETPDIYLPTGTFALFTNKKSVIQATKGTELHRYTNVPGLSGALIEGRYRGDAFILDTLKQGVLAFISTPSIALNKATTSISQGSTEKLVATVNPSDATVTWASSAPTVADVATDGTVTAIANTGTADITASITVNGTTYTDTCTVTATA